MTPDFYLCDRCSSGKVPTNHRLFVATERGMDAAGSMETTGVNLDLCHKCAIEAVKHILNDRHASFDVAARLVGWARSMTAAK